MDCIQTTTTPSTATTAPAKLTYTTAGTIYNPNKANTPLQPPVRRGRSYKWMGGAGNGGYADLSSLLPKSTTLTTLPLRYGSHAPNAITTASSNVGVGLAASGTSSGHQYSPLQQNYDRAVSPGLFRDNDHQYLKLLESINAESASMQRGPKPCPPPSGSSVVQDVDPPVKDDSGNESDMNSDLSLDPLSAMTVKSLQNLASYPNPSQKKARRVLLGATSNVQGAAGAGRGYSPPGLSRKTPSPYPYSMLAPTRTADSGYYGRDVPVPDMAKTYQAHAGDDQERMSPEVKNAMAGFMEPPSLGSKAGPPGQQQGRSHLDVEESIKLFEMIQKITLEERSRKLANARSPASPSGAGADALGWPVDGKLQTQQTADTACQLFARQPSSLSGVLGKTPDPASSYGLDIPDRGVGSAAQQQIMQPAIGTPPANDGRSVSAPVASTGRLTQGQIQKRDVTIDKAWYSTTMPLNKDAVAGPAGDSNIKMAGQGSSYRPGVIGDGRRAKEPAPQQTMSITEAVERPASEHVKPLLDRALETLARYDKEWKVKGGKQQQQREVGPQPFWG